MANLLEKRDEQWVGGTDVSYAYTGDLKRLWRLENGALQQSYQWDASFNVLVGTP